MKNIGSLLLLLGIGSVVLYFIGYEFRALAWVDTWGEAAGWAIRAAFIAAGGLLFFLGSRSEQAMSEAGAPAQRQEPSLDAGPAAAPPASPPASPAEPAADQGKPQGQV